MHAQTPFLYGSPCQQTYLLSLPTIDPLWTCGLRVSGNFTCPAGANHKTAACSSIAESSSHPSQSALMLPCSLTCAFQWLPDLLLVACLACFGSNYSEGQKYWSMLCKCECAYVYENSYLLYKLIIIT